MFEVELYETTDETTDEKKPVNDFILSLDIKIRAKLVGLIKVLEEKGVELREPYSKHLDDGIFELRCKQGTNAIRVLYFFYVGKRIVVTNGFVKKTQKTPKKEIKLAKARRKEWLSRIRSDNE